MLLSEIQFIQNRTINKAKLLINNNDTY